MMKFFIKSFLFLVLLSFTSIGCQSEQPKEPAKPVQTAPPAKKNVAKKNVPVAKLPNLDKLIQLKQHTHYSINRVNDQVLKNATQPIMIKGNSLTMRGWAFDKQSNDAAGAVVIKVGNKTFPANMVPSPGIAKNFKNDKLEKSGFNISIPVGQIGKGEHEVKVLVLTNNKKAIFNPLPVKTVKVKV